MSRILLVEDYPPLATVIRIALRRAGHDVVRVSSLARAREAEGSFDLGVFDVDLPDGDGVTLAGELMAAGTVSRVLFHSSSRDPRALRRARYLGPFVDKSLDVRELVEHVQGVLASGARGASGTMPRVSNEDVAGASLDRLRAINE